MIRIDEAMLAAIVEKSQEQFNDHAVRFLVENFEDARVYDEADLRAFVVARAAQAKTYGFASERQVMLWTLIAWTLGEDFDHEFPTAREFLALPSHGEDDGDDRIKRLFAWALAMIRALTTASAERLDDGE